MAIYKIRVIPPERILVIFAASEQEALAEAKSSLYELHQTDPSDPLQPPLHKATLKLERIG